MHILIAEDEAIIARDIKGILERAGHSVVGVVDTTEAVLAAVATIRPDLVLLDIRLRGGNGWHRGRPGAARHLPCAGGLPHRPRRRCDGSAGRRDRTLRQQHRAKRSNHPISRILIDIDHFKAVNDTWGHPAGDVVLRALSRLLITNVRVEDIVYRYGGEEFLLVLPAAAEAAAYMRAEYIRQQVLNLRVVYNGQTLPPISISAGIALIRQGSIGRVSGFRSSAAERAA